MKLTKDQRTNRYKIRFRTEHGMRQLTTGATTIQEAKQLVKDGGLQHIEAAAKAGKLAACMVAKVLTGQKITMARAQEDWGRWLSDYGRSPRTAAQYVQSLADLFRGFTTPSEITERHVNGWLNDPNRTEKLQTRRSRHAAARSFFEFCAAKGWIMGNPAKLVRVNLGLLTFAQKEPKVREPFMDDEVDALLNHVGFGFWYAAIAFSRDLGLRLGDIACLEWDSFEKPGVAVVWTDKRDRRVEVPLTERCERILSRLRTNLTPSLFPHARAIATSATRRAYLSVEFARLRAEAGVPDKSFHSLRHAYATALAAEGKPLWYISKSMGHSHGATTRGYIH